MKPIYMKHLNSNHLVKNGMLMFLCVIVLSACDRNSSPEGRMSIELENLRKEMIDSLKQQNRAILDSLGKIREDLKEIQQLSK